METMMLFCALFWLDQPMKLAATWKAVCIVESNGQRDAIGDSGNSVGIAQISKICVDDVNRILGHDAYTYGDRLDPQKAFLMFQTYVLHYFPNGGPEQWARCWNGGPDGPYETCTLRYWKRIQGVIKNGTR